MTFLCVQPAAAHPHIFIDAGLKFQFDDQGMLTAVRVNWIYDELYTLMLIEDLDLDPDGDGELTPEEIAVLARQDADWPPDYEGDLYGTADGRPIALGPPRSFGLDYVDGRIISTHLRPLAKPIDPVAHAVIFKTYDPFFYAAFDVTLPVETQGRDCTTEVIEPDVAAAEDKLAALMQFGPDDGALVEQQYPQVGEDFADSVVLTCAGD
ncbi:DUF1007 family protein [Frigidibacter sp. ROC022]|uniref:DUF1007 family protein n=1 Tax=Frigidibacter sp. ROC022 TaxID=2971796 RepID=UPI00215A9A9B|nr:DUF1007 family protein [Frigidibacter sp. ROC022]MCR8723028.1 DUF1007 family protein [Frigidibacter sp. ROC022]